MYADSAIYQQKIEQDEDARRRKGMIISVILHALLLLFCIMFAFPIKESLSEDKPDDEENISLAVKLDFDFQESSLSTYAHEDAGEPAPKAEAAPPAPVESPKPEVATAPEPIKVQAPTVINTPKPDIKLPTPVYTPREEPIPTTKPQETSPVKVNVPTSTSPKPNESDTKVPVKTGATNNGGGSPNSNGATPGAPNGNNSTTSGSGSGSGSSGSGAGASSGNDGSEGVGNNSNGTGEYDGSGDGVFGRRVIYRDVAASKAALSVTGKCVVKICVNQAGIVTFAEINNDETTIRDRAVLKKFLISARRFKVQPDSSAPKEQCGKLIFKTDNTINNKLR
jgi:outer membrane biosynthesis protein TonB